MHKAGFFRSILVAGVLTSFLITAGPALAKKPEWAGNDKGGKHHSGGGYEKQRGNDRDRGGHRESYRSDHGDRRSHRHFSDQHHVVINNYYVNQWKSGPCPPGLAKKRNGCVPPGMRKVGRTAGRCRAMSSIMSCRRPFWCSWGRPPRGTSSCAWPRIY